MKKDPFFPSYLSISEDKLMQTDMYTKSFQKSSFFCYLSVSSSRSWVSLVQSILLSSFSQLVSCSSKCLWSKNSWKTLLEQHQKTIEKFCLKIKANQCSLKYALHDFFPREPETRWQSAGRLYSQQLLLGSWELSGARWSNRKPHLCQDSRETEEAEQAEERKGT